MSCIVPLLSGCPAYAGDDAAGQPDEDYFKLHASVSRLGTTGIRDTVWRYFSDQAARAYAARDYPLAAKLYRAALDDAEKKHSDDRNLALIMTNLASTYREEGELDSAEPLFKRALSVSEKFGCGRGSPYSYTLRQYAALMRKKGQVEEARFALEAAESGSRLSAGTGRLDGGIARAMPPPAPPPSQSPTSQSPLSSLAEESAAAAPPPPLGRMDGPRCCSEEPVIIDFTLVGVGVLPGQQPDAQVLEHSRTYLTGQQADWVRGMVDRLRGQ